MILLKKGDVSSKVKTLSIVETRTRYLTIRQHTRDFCFLHQSLRKLLKLFSRKSTVSYGSTMLPSYSGLALKNPPKKTHPKNPKKTKKTHLKKPAKNVFFLVFWFFFNFFSFYENNTNFSLSNRFFMNK